MEIFRSLIWTFKEDLMMRPKHLLQARFLVIYVELRRCGVINYTAAELLSSLNSQQYLVIVFHTETLSLRVIPFEVYTLQFPEQNKMNDYKLKSFNNQFVENVKKQT